MKAPLRFAVVFAIALPLVTFLPLYVERTMMHIMFADGSGGAIRWNWKICTLWTFWSDFRYFRHHPHPGLWIAANVALAVAYALTIALIAAWVFRRKARNGRTGMFPNVR